MSTVVSTSTPPAAGTIPATPDFINGAHSFSDVVGQLRPPSEVSAEFYAKSWWRHETILHDLYRTAAVRPDQPAFVLPGVAGGRHRTLTYGQLTRHVDRFARALRWLGVRPGEPVAVQLPNRWETPALILACLRVGAVAVPISTTIRRRELQNILSDTQARICVVADSYDGYPHAAVLAEIADQLPWLRHRVVLGDAAATGAVDFEDHFVRTPHENRLGGGPAGLTLDDPDRVALVVFTAGTTGETKGVLHSHNTFAAGAGRHVSEQERGWRAGEVFCAPYGVCDTMALLYCVWGPLLAGGTGVLLDRWDPDLLLDLVSAAGVTQLAAAPPQWAELVTAQRRAPRKLPALRFVQTTGASLPQHLAEEMRALFAVPIHVVWAMTELGMGMRSWEGDPPDGVSRGEGHLVSGLQVDLAPVGRSDDGVFRIRARGPSLCLGMWRRETGVLQGTWDHDEGWLDTGDLMQVSSERVLRYAGRAADRVGITRMIPVSDVEAELMRYPAIQDVAIVSFADPVHGELPCAVVVASGGPPTLAELREYLTWRGMTDWYQPARLEVVEALPRNHAGKVYRGRLRRWLADSR